MPIEFGEPFSFDQSLRDAEADVSYAGEGGDETRTRVLVLGAGLAGLTCAHRYAQASGRPVTRDDLLVLEREPSVGGRVRSLKIESRVMNLGAVTFQPAAYPRYMALLDELGLGDRVRIIPRREMVLGVEGRVVHADNLALAAEGIRSLAMRGVFTPGEAMQLLRFYFYMRRVTSPARFDELLALHDRSVSDWARGFGFGESVRRKFVEPFIGFTFSAPETISAAFGVLLLGFNLSQPAHLVGGMMRLPEALAAKLDGVIETNALALRVERTADGFLTHYRQSDRITRAHSRFVVVALPANVAGELVPEMRERAGEVVYGSGSAALLRGRLNVRGRLQLWRTGGAGGTVLFGGEAQAAGDGSDYFNLLTYRGETDEAVRGGMFRGGQYETLLEYKISPAVAAPQPNQKPLPVDWGDGLYLAGDCTGIFPSQETAVRSGEQAAAMIETI